ncbi:MAG TPA: protease pro-enzyme activation domain-containing protein, partial [Candidatus Elarobacter sp.]|nr:protease pro-enzyme activation domain-containing protein [Candidatus Elarobacter sp.]
MTLQRYHWLAGCAALALLLASPARMLGAASSHVTVPQGALTGLHQAGPADPRTTLHLAIELQPKADLDGLAARMNDPIDPSHKHVLTRADFIDRFGRLPDARAAADLLRRAGATDVEIAGDGLVAGGLMRIPEAERLFATRWMKWTD